MAKVRIGKLASDFDVDVDELIALAKSKLAESMMTGRSGRSLWINEDGQEILEKALDVPEVVPKHYLGRVTRMAPNPRYVYAYISEMKLNVPVLVPKNLRNRMSKKTIKIEAIKDNVGTSFRYVK
jgi:hypothetical protein